MQRYLRVMWITALGLMVLGAHAQDRSMSPGVNRAYEAADYERWRTVFETEGREIFDHRDAIVDALRLTRGMTIADVGAGTGVFTELFAQKVGAGGTVIAQDISAEFLQGIEKRARGAGLGNVRTLLGGEKDAGLPAAGVDLIFTSDTYHHFEYPQAMLKSLRSALKPGGRLIVIDYEKIPGRSSPWVLGHVRADREAVVAEVEAAGFRVAKRHNLLRENYFIEFAVR